MYVCVSRVQNFCNFENMGYRPLCEDVDYYGFYVQLSEVIDFVDKKLAVKIWYYGIITAIASNGKNGRLSLSVAESAQHK